MIGKSYTYKTASISMREATYTIGIQSVQWKTVDVSDDVQSVQGTHGIRMSPTFARGRKVTIEGVVVSDTRAGLSQGMDYLDALFALQGVPSSIEKHPFSVTDEQDRIFTTQAKIKEPIEYETTDSDHLEGAHRLWRVVLLADDPVLYGATLQQVLGAEGYYGGAKLGIKLGAKLNGYYNEVMLSTASSNIPCPLRITLTATGQIDTVTIRNMTNGTFFALDIQADVGDVIVIDTKEYRATKNGINILASRMPGSKWQYVTGTTYLSIYDRDGGLYASDMDITCHWRDCIL